MQFKKTILITFLLMLGIGIVCMALSGFDDQSSSISDDYGDRIELTIKEYGVNTAEMIIDDISVTQDYKSASKAYIVSVDYIWHAAFDEEDTLRAEMLDVCEGLSKTIFEIYPDVQNIGIFWTMPKVGDDAAPSCVYKKSSDGSIDLTTRGVLNRASTEAPEEAGSSDNAISTTPKSNTADQQDFGRQEPEDPQFQITPDHQATPPKSDAQIPSQPTRLCYYREKYGNKSPGELAVESPMVQYYQEAIIEAQNTQKLYEGKGGDFAQRQLATAKFAENKARNLYDQEYNKWLTYYSDMLKDC